jgi:hypothetical protein
MRSAPSLVLLLTLAACGDDIRDPFAGLSRVSGASPYDCHDDITNDVPGAEVEPSVAVDPTDPAHLIGAWQQDRWVTGAASGLGVAVSRDAGATWTASFPPFSTCGGGDFDRATDPWVTIGPDGTAYMSGLGVDAFTGNRNGILVSRSDDGGDTWGEPFPVLVEDDPDVFNDKESITADPTDATRVYATWDRLTGLLQPTMPIGTGPTMFARATDGVWDAARPIFDPGVDEQTIGNVIVVLPDGTLVDLFVHLTEISSDDPVGELAVIRSIDQGDTWSAPVVISSAGTVGIEAPDGGGFVRTGGTLPSIAVDPDSGALYVVWEDARFASRDAVAFSASLDGGLTWSPPAQINGDPSASAFTPAVAVADGGTIGVTYYDLRADPAAFLATAWLATSTDGGASWDEEPLTEPFDLHLAQIGTIFFLGDYQGLAPSGDGFVPFFAAATTGIGAPIDIFARPRE